METNNLFKRKRPCNNCPYRRDAPLQLWDAAEFKDLLEKDRSEFGSIYMCHKKDGCMCIGWLMDQDKRNFPSISLRISLLKNRIDRSYLDSLGTNVPMYNNIEEMAHANYPEKFSK